MSVPLTKRNQNRSEEQKTKDAGFEIEQLAHQVTDYTFDMVTSEKHFPKRYRWCISNKILDKATMIDDYVTLANSIYVRNGDGSKTRRLTYIAKSLELTYSLLNDINRAYRKFGVNSFNVEHWTGIIMNLQTQLRNWYQGERNRYKNIG
jgi:hypothetical protein